MASTSATVRNVVMGLPGVLWFSGTSEAAEVRVMMEPIG
jgi:hypothetical protein